MYRLARHLTILACVVGSVGVAQQAQAQNADDVLGIIADRAAAHGVSATYLQRVARCESRLSLTAVGRQGEQGLFQLHPRGELRTFYARGYDDPWDAFQQADFTAQRFSEGGARAWSCA